MATEVQIAETPDKIDTLDFISEEDPKVAEETALVKPDAEEAAIEEPEEDVELSEPEVKDDELNFEPFKISAVKEKYPNLFKDFPNLKNQIYRSERYEEIFPTIADAESAKDEIATLESARAQLYNGDIYDILKSVRDNEVESFNRVVDNILPTIDKIDRGAYLHIVGNIGKFFIQRMLNERNRFGAESEQGKALNNAALVLNQFLFGVSEAQQPTNLAKPISEDQKKISQREQELIRQRFEEVKSDLLGRIDNTILATINKYIDPKESMTPYVRQKAVDDCKNLLDKSMMSDDRFRANVDRLWQRLIETNFSKEAQEAIKTAGFGKAKSLLGDIIKKVRNDALSGMRVKSAQKQSSDLEEDKPRKSRVNPATSNSRPNEDGPKRGESTKAWLDRTLG